MLLTTPTSPCSCRTSPLPLSLPPPPSTSALWGKSPERSLLSTFSLPLVFLLELPEAVGTGLLSSVAAFFACKHADDGKSATH